MDRRRLNHITAVFLAAVVLVVALMLFHSFRSPPSLVLPEEQDSSQLPPDSGDQQEALGTVSVTPETVQTAIATLERPEQYRGSICVEQYWDDGRRFLGHLHQHQRCLDPDGPYAGQRPCTPLYYGWQHHLYLV